MKRDFGEILNECIDRLVAGEPLDEILSRHPEHVDALAPALRDAQLLHRSGPPVNASAAAQAQAMQVLNDQLRRAPVTAATTSPPSPVVAIVRRGASFRAMAVAGGLAVFGALGVGAATAGSSPLEPVRGLFDGSAGAAIRVEFDGVIASVDPNTSTLEVVAGDDRRTVRAVESTELSRGGDAIPFEALAFAVGSPVEVKGALQVDDTIIASRVHLEDEDDDDDDDDDDDVPGMTPTPDDDDNEDRDDADDEDDEDDEDNSGPGNAEQDDDEDEDDNAGPGNAEGDGADNSGPGNNEDDDDNSSGSDGSDDGGEDNSGPGGGDND